MKNFPVEAPFLWPIDNCRHILKIGLDSDARYVNGIFGDVIGLHEISMTFFWLCLYLSKENLSINFKVLASILLILHRDISSSEHIHLKRISCDENSLKSLKPLKAN